MGGNRKIVMIMMNRKMTALGAVFLAGQLLLAGCSQPTEKQAESELSSAISVMDASSQQTEDGLVTYAVLENANTDSIKNGNLEYVPFCDANEDLIGKEIGKFKFPGQDDEHYVYEMNGQPSDQWVVVAAADKKDAQVYREMQVTDYPEGLVSDYPWN